MSSVKQRMPRRPTKSSDTVEQCPKRTFQKHPILHPQEVLYSKPTYHESNPRDQTHPPKTVTPLGSFRLGGTVPLKFSSKWYSTLQVMVLLIQIPSSFCPTGTAPLKFLSNWYSTFKDFVQLVQYRLSFCPTGTEPFKFHR